MLANAALVILVICCIGGMIWGFFQSRKSRSPADVIVGTTFSAAIGALFAVPPIGALSVIFWLCSLIS